MINAYNSALSGVRAFGSKIAANAGNIANVDTEGYKRVRVNLAETHPAGVTEQIERVNTPGTSVYQQTSEGEELVELSNVDLAQELTETNLNSRFYQANLKTIQTVEEMTGTLLDIKR